MVTRLLLMALATSSVAWGQAPSNLPESAVVVDQSCGLQEQDGELWGLGSNYKARFTATGMEFTPALGIRAPRNLPVRLEFHGAGRGDRQAVGTTAAAARRSTGDLTVRFHHEPCVETYAVRPEGVELSYTFHALPEGEGDLWVRTRLDTDLNAIAEGFRTQLELSSGDLGGVRIGAVTGIDAAGRKAPGTMRVRDGTLELRLPAAFVDAATLPLVLDPLIGTTITIPGTSDDEHPDVAYHAQGGTSVYLAVWHRRFSSNDTDVRAQRLDTEDLSLVGGLIGIRTNSTLASDFPTVATVALRDRFVVAWRERNGGNPSYLAACSVALTGAVGSAIQVVAGSDSFASPDVAGDHHDLGAWALLVYANTTQSRVERVRLVVAGDGSLSQLGRGVLASDATSAAISQDGGAAGRYAVVWNRRLGFNDAWVEGAVLDRFTNVRDTLAVTAPGNPSETSPHVDGDGDHWIVTYDRRPTGAPIDVYARWITFDSRTDDAYLAQETVVASGSDVQQTSNVCFLYGCALVAYLDQRTGFVYDAFVNSIDLFSCALCEGRFALDSAPSGGLLRTLRSSRGPNGGVLIWEAQDSLSNGNVRARAFRQETGFVIRGANTCGGRVHATCARRGNSAFALRLEHAAPNVPALLVISPQTVAFTCSGGCSMLDPFRGLVLPAGTTDSRGDLAVSVPLPIGPALPQTYFQFAYLPAGTALCPQFGVDVSSYGWLALID